MSQSILKKINPVIAVLAVALIVAVSYIIMNETDSKTGVDILDKKIFNDVTVDCSDIDTKIINSKVTVKVHNSSEQTINGLSVKVIAFDEDGNEIKTKVKRLDQTLSPHATISRTINFPKKTKQCKCMLESTTTQY